MCSAKFEFVSDCVSAFICFERYTFLTNTQFGAVITFKFHTPVDLYLSCLVLCVILFVRCLWSVLFVVYAMLYLSYLKLLKSRLKGYLPDSCL